MRRATKQVRDRIFNYLSVLTDLNRGRRRARRRRHDVWRETAKEYISIITG